MNKIMKNRKFKSLCVFTLATTIMCHYIPSSVQAAPKESLTAQVSQIEHSTIQVGPIKDAITMSISSDRIVLELEKIGFTKNEMYDLYKMEANRLRSSIKLPDLLKADFGEYVFPSILARGLPTNPTPGTYYDAPFDINFRSLAEDLMALGCVGSLSNIPALISSAPKSLLTKAVIKYLGIGAIATAGIGGILFLIDKYVVDSAGIRGYQTWYYGDDNQGGISWTPGYINATRYY